MFGGSGKRSLAVRTGIAAIASVIAVGSFSSLAVHENVEFPAAIHAGTCEAPGDVVMELPNLVRLLEDAPDEGEPTGAASPQVIHGLPDDTEIALTVDDLFAADHIVAVFDAEGANIVACGPIGAYTFEDGQDLAFGLRSNGDSPYTGVVLIDNEDDDDDDELDVEIYLVNNTPAPAATPVS